jgi:hypothetical protein
MPRTDQPSGVRTKDVPRPPDNSVVTDELQASGQGEAATGKPEKKSGDKSGSNDEDSAARTPKEGDDPNSQHSRRDRHAEKRIRKLTRRLAAERDRNTANDRRIQSLEQQIDEIKKAPAASTAPEPELKDFKSPQEYAKAYAKWEGAKAGGKPPKAADDDSTERQPPAKRKEPPPREVVADQEDVKAFSQRGKKKLGDEFLDAMESAAAKEFAVSKVMGDFILEHELGPEIFVYLADNPELSRRIYDKSETFAVKELRKLAAKAKAGKLADSDPDEHAEGDEDEERDDDEREDDDERGESRRKGGDREDSDDELERRQTKAPKPKESGDDRGQPNAVVDLDDLDMDAYAEARRKQQQARRRF